MQATLFNNSNNILPFNGEVFFYPGFFTKGESDTYLQTLLSEIEWKQEPIKIFGKTVMQPRLTAWYGDDDKTYTYSGITMQPHFWSPALKTIKEKIETVSPVKYTSALLNLYRNGLDSMGWHRDNEKELGENPVIASVSFGGTRTFRLRNYRNKNIVKSIELTHGSLLLMQGETQHYWEHQIPKTSAPVKERVNITFRVIVNGQ